MVTNDGRGGGPRGRRVAGAPPGVPLRRIRQTRSTLGRKLLLDVLVRRAERTVTSSSSSFFFGLLCDFKLVLQFGVHLNSLLKMTNPNKRFQV